MFNFPDSGVNNDVTRLKNKLLRKDQIIDRLLALTKEYNLPVDHRAVVNDSKVIPIDQVRRRRGREK